MTARIPGAGHASARLQIAVAYAAIVAFAAVCVVVLEWVALALFVGGALAIGYAGKWMHDWPRSEQ